MRQKGLSMTLSRWKRICTGRWERWAPRRMEVFYSREWGAWLCWLQGSFAILGRHRTRIAAMRACEEEACRDIQAKRRKRAYWRPVIASLLADEDEID